MVMVDTEKAELLNVFIALVFTAKAGTQALLSLETTGKTWRVEDFPQVEGDWVRGYLGKLDTQKSMGPNGMQPRVLRNCQTLLLSLSLSSSKGLG